MPKMPSATDWKLLQAAPPTPIMISAGDMFFLLGTIQLSLRHPQNSGPSSQLARGFARELEKRIVKASPGFAELCKAGWDPPMDVE